MINKLDIILRTAEILLEDYPDGWQGDIHDFATASASTTPDERLWLTSYDVKDFHHQLSGGSFISEYAFISASLEQGEPLLIIEDVDSGKV